MEALIEHRVEANKFLENLKEMSEETTLQVIQKKEEQSLDLAIRFLLSRMRSGINRDDSGDMKQVKLFLFALLEGAIKSLLKTPQEQKEIKYQRKHKRGRLAVTVEVIEDKAWMDNVAGSDPNDDHLCYVSICSSLGLNGEKLRQKVNRLLELRYS